MLDDPHQPLAGFLFVVDEAHIDTTLALAVEFHQLLLEDYFCEFWPASLISL